MTEVETRRATGVTLAFTFPLGRFHATAMGTSANDGVVEWPPSPWRILRALVAMWKTRCTELDDAVVETTLAALVGEPHYYLDPQTAVGHTRHYMPYEKNGEEATTLVHDTFISVVRTKPALYVTWPLAELDESQRAALQQLVGSLTWLGRAESLVEGRLLSNDEMVPAANAHAIGDQHAVLNNPIRLLVPTAPLDLDALCVNLQEFRSNAKTRATLPPRAVMRTYERPMISVAPTRSKRVRSRRKPTAVRFSIVPAGPQTNSESQHPSFEPTSGRRAIGGVVTNRSAARLKLADAIVFTSQLRRTAMSRYGFHANGKGSATLSGRSETGPRTGHSHAHYLPLSAAKPIARSYVIDRLLVWAPEGFGDDELAALQGIRRVKEWGWVSASREFWVVADGVGTPSELAPHLVGESAQWCSVTPVVAGRHHQGKRSWEEQMTQELNQAIADRGLPPAEISLSRWPGPFTTSRPRSGKSAHRSHPQRFNAMINFAEPIRLDGPLCLGAHSHFGLGIFEPRTDS